MPRSAPAAKDRRCTLHDYCDCTLLKRGSVQLRDYITLLRRSWLLIVACAAIGASAGAIIALSTPTMYRASTQLWISVSNTGAASDLAQSTSFARQAVTSYVQVVPTALVLDPVITELSLDLDSQGLASYVKASSSLNSRVITIEVANQDPSEAAQITNAVATSFAAVVETELERPAVDANDSKVRAEILSAANVPTSPSSPNTPLNIILGTLAGLAIGIIASLLRVVLDTRVHTLTDVEDTVDAPILGGIAFDPDAANRPLIVQAEPRDPRSEAFRRLRTNLQYIDFNSDVPSVVITSAAPSEGKSTTAANLALALAASGVRVALVDADLRKPRVADTFGIEGGVGLTDVLVGRVRLSEAIQPWNLGKLFLLPSGTLPPNPAEVLGSAAMSRTLAELRAAFDYIVLDAPPLLAVTDAAVLARLTSGAILVAASGRTRKPQLEGAAKALSSADARLLGVVMTKLPTRGPDSYGYGEYTYASTHPQAGGRN